MKKICVLFFILISQLLFAQSNKLIYSGTFKNGLYAFGKSEEAVQEKVLKVLEEAIVKPTSDEWDPNVSESWSTLKSNFPNQQITILSDSAQHHYMMCRIHAEFYPKSGTKVMADYLKRQQQSLDNEKRIQADLRAQKITSQQAGQEMNKSDIDIWGAPSHIDVFTNDFPLSDSVQIKITEPNVSDCKEIIVEGADYATTCTERSLTNIFRVTTIYLGNYSKDVNGNLQLQHSKSLQWEKQNTIKIKLYGPDNVALLLLKNFDLQKLKTLLK